MLNPIRAIKGIKAVINDKPAKLCDCDIVSGYIHNENAQQRLNSKQYELFYKKYIAYHNQLTLKNYNGYDDFMDRLVLIISEFSECGDYHAFLYSDAGSQLVLEHRIPLILEKKKEIFKCMAAVITELISNVNTFSGDVEVSITVYRLCIVWFFAAVIAMIIDNCQKGDFSTLTKLYEREIHDDITDMEFWHALRQHNTFLKDAINSQPFPQAFYDFAANKLRTYASRIDIIMQSDTPMMKKCRQLGTELNAVFGLSYDENDIRGYAMEKTFNKFIEYVVENKM